MFWFEIGDKKIYCHEVVGHVFFCLNKDLRIEDETTPKHPATCLAFYPSELKPVTGRMVHGTDARNPIALEARKASKGHLLCKEKYPDLEHDTFMLTAQPRNMSYRKVFYSKYRSTLYFKLQQKDIDEIRRQERKYWQVPTTYEALHE